MKRFYCTVCKKVKRVRRLPALLQNEQSIDPSLRVGACNRHFEAKPAKVTRLVRGEWTEANKEQADGRMNRTNTKVRKVR